MIMDPHKVITFLNKVKTFLQKVTIHHQLVNIYPQNMLIYVLFTNFPGFHKRFEQNYSSGKAAMDCRQGFLLRFPLALWSGALALFSKIT